MQLFGKSKQNISLLKLNFFWILPEKIGISLSLECDEKIIASKVYCLLTEKKRDLINKKVYLSDIKKKIYELGISKIDYIKILDINKLIKPHKNKIIYKVFIAYYLANTRLIDNI